MGTDNCWNCGASVGKRANYCSQCAYPIDPDFVFQEFVRAVTLNEDIMENARGLLTEGMRNHHTEAEVREYMETFEKYYLGESTTIESLDEY